MLFFLNDNKKPFILGLNVPKVTAYGHQENTEIYNSISNFRNNHSDRINELDSLINSLQVKKIEDSFNIVNNDN